MTKDTEVRERPYPQLLDDDERKALLLRAENLWSDLQANNLGGFSGINRPFYILHEFKSVVEEFGNRDVGLSWSKDQLDAALATPASDVAPVALRDAAFRIANMHMLAVGASLSTVDERARYVRRLADEIVSISVPSGHWLEPYRTMDAGGSPETAGQVGHSWLIDIARAEHDNDPAALEIDMPRLTEDGTAQILYRGPKVIAACFIVRDPMNFAILFRYLAHPPLAQSVDPVAGGEAAAQWAIDAKIWTDNSVRDIERGYKYDWPMVRAFARFQAEIEAATIERCAGVVETLDMGEPWSTADRCSRFHTRNAIATAIRNLKGQTS